MRCHTARYANSTTLPVRIAGYVKSVMSVKERVMTKVMTKGCTCNQLDDELKDEGWTCYACYEADNE
jgi:hypothetical protein